MKRFIINYAQLCRQQDSSICKIAKLLFFVILLKIQFSYAVFDINQDLCIQGYPRPCFYLITMLLSFIPYCFIQQKYNNIYSLFITIYLYSCFYAGIITFAVFLAGFVSDFLIPLYIIITNPNIINLFIASGFLFYLMKKKNTVS